MWKLLRHSTWSITSLWMCACTTICQFCCYWMSQLFRGLNAMLLWRCVLGENIHVFSSRLISCRYNCWITEIYWGMFRFSKYCQIVFSKCLYLKLPLCNGGWDFHHTTTSSTLLGATGRIPFLKFVFLMINNKIGYFYVYWIMKCPLVKYLLSYLTCLSILLYFKVDI